MEKSTIRKHYLSKRTALSDAEKSSLDTTLTQKAIDVIGTYALRAIHCYLPREKSAEIDTFELIRKLWLQGKRVCAPYIIPGTSEMQHFYIEENQKLKINKWGIPEPDPLLSEQAKPADIAAVIVPLLAFDKNGFRVGYGGGFYDRFLPQCKPDVLKIGLSYFEALDSIVDADPYDIPLDICITPSEIFYWI